MNLNETPPIRCYGKTELALLYFPTLAPKMAIKKLRRWIKKCTALDAALHTHCYDLNARMFSACEVRLIFHPDRAQRARALIQRS